MRIRRAYGGFTISGKHKFVTFKWLNPGVRAIRAGIRQIQFGRVLIRISWRLKCGCCGRSRM